MLIFAILLLALAAIVAVTPALRRIVMAMLTALFLIVAALPALAQTGGAGLVAPLIPHVMEIIGILLTAIIGWAAAKARQKWGIDIQAHHREALHWALHTGTQLALERKLTGEAARSLILDYVRRSVPDALAAISPSPATLENLAESKLEEARRALTAALKK